MRRQLDVDTREGVIRKEYLCQVTVIEARNLKINNATGVADPFVRITVANNPPQITNPIYERTSGTWNQSFTFGGVELEKFEILIEVLSLSSFLGNTLIGSFSIGLATLYKSMNHEFYMTWLTLTDPADQGSDQEIKGYLLVSCYIIGAKDTPPVHSLNEGLKDPDNDEFGDTPDEDLTPEQLAARRDKMKNYSILSDPTLIRKNYQLNINIARAEELLKVGMSGTNPFISCRVGNTILKTAAAEGSQKPKFSTRLKYPVSFPLHNDKIVMKCWHRRTLLTDFSMTDVFIANIPENPFIDSWFNINYLQSTGGNLPFTWINMYGIPPDDRDGWFQKLITSKSRFIEGTFFMGRVLLSMNLIPHEKPEKGTQYLSGSAEPESTAYKLRADIVELHINNAEAEVWIEVMFGSKNEVKLENPELDTKNSDGQMKKFRWKGKKVQANEISEVYPIDTQQVPDVFLHIYTKTFMGSKRIGYVRVPANDATMSHNFANWYLIKDPKNNYDGKSPGLLLANLRMLQGEATKAPRSLNRYDNEQQLNLYIYVYSCVELAPEARADKVKARIELSFCDLKPNINTHLEQKREQEEKERETIKGSVIKEKVDDGKDDDAKSVLSGKSGKSGKSSKVKETKEKKEKEKKKVAPSMIIESQHITKNPIFGKNLKGEIIVAQAKVTGGLDMAPSLILTVYNLMEPKMFSENTYEEIGSCFISPTQCQVVKGVPGELDNSLPQYYPIHGPDGTIQGKILMLVAFSKNMKESIQPEDFRNEFDKKFERPDNRFERFKLDFSCIGLRNLDAKCPSPEITLRIPSYQLMLKFKPTLKENEFDEQEAKLKARERGLPEKPDQKKKMESSTRVPNIAEAPVLKDREMPVKFGEELLYLYKEPDTSLYVSSLIPFNPNICMTNCVKELTMPSNPLFWPRVEIEATYKNMFMMTAEYFSTVDLVECSMTLPKHKASVLKEKLGMIRKSNDGGGEDNEAGNDDKGKRGMADAIEREITSMYRNTSKAVNMEKAGKGGKSTVKKTVANAKTVATLKDKNNEGDATERPTKLLENLDDDDIDDNRQSVMPKGFVNPDHKPTKEPEESKSVIGNQGNQKKKKGETTGPSPEEMNKLIFEAIERNRIPNVFYEELEPLNLISMSSRKITPSGFYNGFSVECPTFEKRMEKNRRLIEIKQTMEKIKILKKTPNYDENELSELLRNINRIKAEFMTEKKFFGYAGKEENTFNYGRDVIKGSVEDKLTLPYKRIELFQFQIGNLLQKGSNSTREHNFVFSGVKRGAVLKGGIRLTHLDATVEQPAAADGLNSEYEFDIYKQFMLNYFKEQCQIKVRFYVIRALNLAAQSDTIQVKYKIAGYNALSSADTFPVVQVGDAENNVDSGVTKKASDDQTIVEQTLNPDYYKMYELDAFLPADWQLVFAIYNKGPIFLMNKLIGQKAIDIEDRYFSDLFRLRTYSLEKRSENIKDSIKSLTGLNPIPQDQIAAKERDLKELAMYLKPLLQNRPLNPIEYCFLTQPGLNTMQGSAEILVEAIHPTETRKIPAAKFEPPKPVKYQIRLIIWEAFDIPKGDRKAIDVFFRVTLDNEGWAVDEVSKETDTHLGSDGYAIYNWRMLFNLSLPCAFPRLKIVAYDMATFGSDDSIGEVTLKFDNIIHKLRNEGRYEAPQKRVKLRNVKEGGAEAGDVVISFKILQSSEAAGLPVGEGQDEPNTDPVLERPKMGRGMGDFLKSLSFNFTFSFGLFFIIMKYAAMAAGALMVFAVLFIKPGILT